jgi:hypothetical protein
MKHFDSRTTLRGAGFGDVAAANDEQGPVPATPAAASGRVPVTAGWDPFEIWRTRVRDARRELPATRGS